MRRFKHILLILALAVLVAPAAPDGASPASAEAAVLEVGETSAESQVIITWLRVLERDLGALRGILLLVQEQSVLRLRRDLHQVLAPSDGSGDHRMNSAVLRNIALAVTAVAAYGAAGEATPGPQALGPNLVLLDSIVLQETDDLYVGRAMTMFLGPDSSFFVIDPFANAIVRFDRNGRALRSYGGTGDGPGEFRLIGPAGFATRTVLGARDGRMPRVRLEFLDLQSGESVGGATATSVSAFFLHGETLWIGGMDTDINAPLVDGPIDASWKSLTRRSLGGLLEGQTRDSVISMDLVPVPRPYRADPMIQGRTGWVRLHVSDHDVVVGFGSTPFLLRANHGGELMDTIPLRAGTRPWVADENEFIELIDSERPRPEDGWPIATLWDMSRDDSGNIYTVHAVVRRVGQQAQGKLYVSSLKPDGSGQCPDTLIPTSDLSMPITVFRGNELFVLDRRIGGAGLRTVVRRFAVDPVNCAGEIMGGGS